MGINTLSILEWGAQKKKMFNTSQQNYFYDFHDYKLNMFDLYVSDHVLIAWTNFSGGVLC